MTTINRKETLNAIKLLKKVVRAKCTMPILSHVRLSTYENMVRLEGSDLETSLRVSISAVGKETSCTTINLAAFESAIKASKDTEVNISILSADKVKVDSLTLDAVSDQDYPSIFQDRDIFHIDTISTNPNVLAAIERIISHASKDYTRYNLNGVYFDCKASQLVVTDGHRLAIEACELRENRGFIVTADACKLLTALSGDGFTLSIIKDAARRPDYLVIKTNTGLLAQTRLINGEFPDYRQVLPKGKQQTMTIKSDDLESYCNNAIVTNGGKLGKGSSARMEACLEFHAANGVVDLYAKGNGKEWSKNNVGKYKGEPCSFGINAYYLLDAVKSIGEKETTIAWIDSLKAIELTAPASSVRVIVMPMRLAEKEKAAS